MCGAPTTNGSASHASAAAQRRGLRSPATEAQASAALPAASSHQPWREPRRAASMPGISAGRPSDGQRWNTSQPAAAVHSACGEYMAEPSPTTHSTGERSAPSDAPSAAGMPHPSPPPRQKK